MTEESRPAGRARGVLAGCGRPSGPQLLWAMVFAITMGVGLTLVRKLALPTAVQYLIAVAPLFAGAQYLRVLARDIRKQLDELQIRIYMEAAATVVCGLFILMISYPLLQAAHLVGPLDHFVVEVLIAVLGIAGYISGVRRYR